MLRLLAFVLPLGLDSFAVAAAFGAAGATAWRARLRISVIFVVFEAGMPLIGLAVGSGLARAIGPIADYVAAAAVIGVGAWMLTDREDEDRIGRLAGAGGLAIIAVGASVSADELAIGFSLGLTSLPVIAVVVAIGVQALVASQLGLVLGALVSERFRERAEQIAGLALIGLGCYLIIERALT